MSVDIILLIMNYTVHIIYYVYFSIILSGSIGAYHGLDNIWKLYFKLGHDSADIGNSELLKYGYGYVGFPLIYKFYTML